MAKEQSAPLPVAKTYKMFIDGQFPRTESGRYYCPDRLQPGKTASANICQASRKDARNAIVAARGAQAKWNDRSAYNRSQIIYRIAEMLQGRAGQFVDEIVLQGASADQAKKEVQATIDCLIYYAGWCDKFQQIFSSVNPVASSHFNFSLLEPMGVVFGFAPPQSSLLGLVSMIAPVIVSGNTCVVLAAEQQPLCAITLCEVLKTSDVPGGVVNVLTGFVDELLPHVAKHMDVNAIAAYGLSAQQLAEAESEAASNLKRVIGPEGENQDVPQSPYSIEKFCELKTTWHPIEKISATGSGY